MARVIVGLALLFAFGCGPGTMGVRIQSSTGFNSGRPFRLVVEETDALKFNEETYEAAAARALTSAPPVLESRIIYPCRRTLGFFGNMMAFLTPWRETSLEDAPCESVEFDIERPENEMVGLFFLLTDPDGIGWKQLVGPPLPSQVVIDIEGNRIAQHYP